MNNTIESFYAVSVFLDGTDISHIVKSVNYSIGLQDLCHEDGRVRKRAVYKGEVHIRDGEKIPGVPIPCEVKIILTESKRWFFPIFSYSGLATNVVKRAIEIHEMYWSIEKDPDSILARFLRWL